ncbi:MAG: hypothetical protein WC679_00460 [Bacteroidales bacterium]|jgi:hypothetical protein
MTESDLYRKFANVVDLCADKNVSRWNCIKYDGEVFDIMTTFTRNPDYYEFAIAIIDDTPIFENDILYDKDGNAKTAKEWSNKIYIDGFLTTKKQVNTLYLNGLALPMPCMKQFSKETINIHFETSEKANRFLEVFMSIINGQKEKCK